MWCRGGSPGPLDIPVSFPGLSYPVFKGIMKKGYKVPTPIQRKVRSLDGGWVWEEGISHLALESHPLSRLSHLSPLLL